ncbi:Reversal of tor2 lethality [Tilletia horrida]|uniref:Reversal of tor2 lethality n=1 Tax=Tilletia horrida TaxID=155126 RepID=A0AAN6GKT8_9BASI|nr:Reversal of tor2 lethality [Tilletia horrida]
MIHFAAFVWLVVIFAAQSLSGTKADNVTSLEGTWASGAGNVKTGLGFFNPVTREFTLPKTAGISYSFTNDGFFEQAQMTYQSNPKAPACFNATLIWQHGTYELYRNGSIGLTPFPQDGYVAIINPCANPSNPQITSYKYQQFTLISQWYNYVDPYPMFPDIQGKSAYALQTFAFDGQKNPLMWLLNRPPSMLPTEQIWFSAASQHG